MVTSSKHRDHQLNKHALAVKISEPRVRRLNGVDLQLIQKVSAKQSMNMYVTDLFYLPRSSLK